MDNSEPERATKRSALLCELARVQGHHGDSYVARGPWRVRARDLTATRLAARLFRPQIPGLGPKIVGGLAVSARWRAHVDLPIQNEAVQIADSGERVRTFDPKDGSSHKLVLRDSKYGKGVDADLSVRHGLLVDARVPHPRVRNSARWGDHIMIQEELVSGRRFLPPIDRGRIPEGLVEPLSRLYAQAGPKQVPLAEWLGPGRAQAIAALEAGLGPDTPALRRARRLVERNPMITLGFGHGDFLPSNLAVSRDGVCFLDWETAGYAPVAFDLLRLWRKYPRVTALARGAGVLVHRYQTGAIDLRDTASLSLALCCLGGTSDRARLALRQWTHLPAGRGAGD
ncbi:hypothetical protein CKO28_15700 [Rhodovibrio sodomensis]|uniref:Aminoglycoside phosphotransferase domain-containing protein n=1 Tax=Rhodovibrio sodomensis TaxID=1088 RepID=A0ABS1DIZ3_9PROT|nr:phosphotransferase [Rhodovibrio sodomensis]MBK1669483.1 hypothetical protein [Rhodovibrio sodomensis]